MRYRGFNLTAVWLLIGINFLLFFATFIKPDLIPILGLQPAGFLDRPWTLVTNLFIHGGIWHILTNMLTLYFFGGYLCQLIGVRNFLITYFCGGILGNILYLFIPPHSLPAIGASGAIFALGGVLTAMRPRLRVFIFPIPAPLPLWVAVIGGFLLLSFFPNVAWQAHLGGLVFGLVAGYFFRRRARYFF
jgi:membrane associated rhomboid family serine protease